MSVAPGDRFPDVTLKVLDAAGAWADLATGTLFAGRRGVLFGLPGAFTPTCTTHHLPGYARRAADFRARGIDLLACLSVNDAFVMRAWADSLAIGDAVRMLPDGNGDLTRALGLVTDASAYGMGPRAQRFALIVNDRTIEGVHVEAPGEYRVSDADYVLRHLG